MTKWRTVRVKQELLEAVERTLEPSRYQSLSEFVSEAVRLRLEELRQVKKETLQKQGECPIIHERLMCSPHHIWTMVTPEGTIRLGLSDHAQERLKGIAKIETDPVGHEAEKGKPFGSVETWMFKFDLYAPVSGKIAKVNRALGDKPSLINEDPYEAGWIAEIKPDNIVTLEEELRDLMGPKQYKLWAMKQRRFAHTKIPAPA